MSSSILACGRFQLDMSQPKIMAIINVTADNVVRLVPPLCFNVEHSDLLSSILVPMIREFLTAAPARAAT